MIHRTATVASSILTACVMVSSIGEAAVVTGQVTGDVAHLPWRKGKKTLGWASVRVWQGGKLIRVGRTHMAGTFRVELPSGPCEVEVMRPAFVTQRRALTPRGEDVRWNPDLRADPDFGLIVEPRAGMSEFCAPGQTIRVECAAPSGSNQWTAELRTEYLRIPLTVAPAQFGERNVWLANRPGWRLGLRVPKDAPPGFYRLRVAYRDAGGAVHSGEQPGAVRLLDHIPERFRMLMHTDFHMNWFVSRPGGEGEVQSDYFRAAGLLNALWVSLGDDIGLEGDDHVAMFWHLLRHACRTPVFLSFGNHDAAITQAGHEYYFGPPVQTRRIGSTIAIVRSFDLYQANWYMPEQQARHAAAALEAVASQPQTRVIYLAGHQRRWRPPGEHFDLPSSLDAFLRLNHARGATVRDLERLFLHPFSVKSMHGWGGLPYTTRIVDVNVSASRVRVSPEIILPSVTYEPANDGTGPRVTAHVRARGATQPMAKYLGVAGGFTQPPTVDTMIPYGDLTDLALTFVMPRGRYQVSRGRVVRQTDAGVVTLVQVRVGVEGEEERITVAPVGQ